MSNNKRLAWIALLLLVPVPSLGAWMAFYGSPGQTGQSVYFAAKVWIALFPLMWLLRAEHGWPSSSRLAREDRRLGIVLGLSHGLALSTALCAVVQWKGDAWIDVAHWRSVLSDAGVTTATRYLVLGGFLCLVNSLIEEYVWRWFVLRQCKRVMGGVGGALAASLFFATHHAIVFCAQFGLETGLLAAFAVFAAGCLWSWCYLRFNSIWPGWISHVLIDITGLALGWRLLFA